MAEERRRKLREEVHRKIHPVTPSIPSVKKLFHELKVIFFGKKKD